MPIKQYKAWRERRNKAKKIGNTVAERMVGYIVAAFGLVAGLAWNDAIRTLIETIFPIGANTIIAKFIYASVLTLLVVLVGIYLLNLFKAEEDNKNGKK